MLRAQPLISRLERRSSSRTKRSPTATKSNSATRTSARCPRRATRRRTTHTLSPTEEPWLVFTGDALLVGDVGRPDLHAGGDPLPLGRQLYGSLQRLLELPDGVAVYPSHYAGSVCGRALSGNPFSTIGFERRHNGSLAAADAESFARALLIDLPPPPADQAEITAANKRGLVATLP